MKIKWLNIVLILFAILVIAYKLVQGQDFNKIWLSLIILIVIKNFVELFKKNSMEE